MAINGPTLVNGTWYNTTNLGTYDTNAGTNTYTVSLVAGRRYFMAIESFSAGAAENVTSVTHDPVGTPLSFARVTDGTTDAQLTGFGLSGNVFEVWQVNVTSTTATALIRIIFGGTQSACGAGLFYIDGEDDTGTIVQVVKATGLSTTPAVTMAAFGATDNLLLFAVCRDDITGGFTPTEGRSELYENQETERNWSTTHYQNPNGGDTSVNCTITSDDWAAIGIEVKAAVAGNDVVGTDSATVTDTFTSLQADASPTEIASLSAEAPNGTLDASAADTQAVADVPLGLLDASATDSASLSGEVAQADIFTDVQASDSLSIADAFIASTLDALAADTPTLSAESTIASLDALAADTVSESEAGLVQADASATDAQSVADAAAVDAFIASLDTASVTEVGSAQLGGQDLAAADSASLSEAALAELFAAGTESLAIQDAITQLLASVSATDTGNWTETGIGALGGVDLSGELAGEVALNGLLTAVADPEPLLRAIADAAPRMTSAVLFDQEIAAVNLWYDGEVYFDGTYFYGGSK